MGCAPDRWVSQCLLACLHHFPKTHTDRTLIAKLQKSSSDQALFLSFFLHTPLTPHTHTHTTTCMHTCTTTTTYTHTYTLRILACPPTHPLLPLLLFHTHYLPTHTLSHKHNTHTAHTLLHACTHTLRRTYTHSTHYPHAHLHAHCHIHHTHNHTHYTILHLIAYTTHTSRNQNTEGALLQF